MSLHSAEKKDAQEDYELNRFKPAIAKVITEHIEDKLSTTEFPFVKDPVAGTSARSASVDGRSARCVHHLPPFSDTTCLCALRGQQIRERLLSARHAPSMAARADLVESPFKKKPRKKCNRHM